jgi:hypothetical protein
MENKKAKNWWKNLTPSEKIAIVRIVPYLIIDIKQPSMPEVYELFKLQIK